MVILKRRAFYNLISTPFSSCSSFPPTPPTAPTPPFIVFSTAPFLRSVLEHYETFFSFLFYLGEYEYKGSRDVCVMFLSSGTERQQMSKQGAEKRLSTFIVICCR